MSNYKLGLCSISFRDKSPEEILIAMKNAGLSYIEWGSDVHAPKDDTEKLQNIAKLQKQYGIECSSYGTYFRLGVNPLDELEKYINSSIVLGTDILRLWCGKKNSEEYNEQEKTALFQECKKAAKIAEKYSVTLCMECHNHTYTNTKESAFELMQTVNSAHFRMYWQPNQFREFEENVAYAQKISPYTKHIHVFQWRGQKQYPLNEGIKEWQAFLKSFSGKHTLLLEFMPDDSIVSLKNEADALRRIAEV